MTYVLLDSATARVEARGVSVNDLDARVLVDGDEVGSCHRQLAHKGVDCKLGEYGVELSESSRVELIIDANGERLGTATLEQSVPAHGNATVPLTVTGKLTTASLTLFARSSPVVPLPTAQALDVTAGGLLAVLLALIARRHLHIIAALAAGLGLVGMFAVGSHRRELEPLLVAAPMGLGACAIVCALVDWWSSRTSRKGRTAIVAVAAGLLGAPLLSAAFASIPSYIVIAAIALIGVVLFTR
jgi:hypothetical protein